MNDIVELWSKEHRTLLGRLQVIHKQLCEKMNVGDPYVVLDQFLKILEDANSHINNEETNIYPELRALLEKNYSTKISHAR